MTTIKLSRIREILKAKHFKSFAKFMEGQTVELENGETMIFEDDFYRWLNGLKVAD